MSPNARWYDDGIRFSCTQCGRCCSGPEEGYVWLTRDEARAIARHLRLDDSTFGRRYMRRVDGRLSLIEKANKDCVFYDGGCTVYAVRPTQCRTFPFWPQNLRSRPAWDAIEAGCPGAQDPNGRLYAKGEIDRLRRGDGETSVPGRA